jgi:ABC-type antimicrobial peptide transport system permease subunit
MLLIALVVGSAVGIGVSSVLFARLDPLPATAPSPSLFLPVSVGIVLMIALAALTVVGALLADRSARRASVVEVLRYE